MPRPADPKGAPRTRSKPPDAPPGSPRLLELLRSELRARHYSPRTEQAYTLWVRRFVRFHGMRHPRDMGEEEVNAYLTHLAVDQKLSASTQTQALSALILLYRHVEGRELGDLRTEGASACPWSSPARR